MFDKRFLLTITAFLVMVSLACQLGPYVISREPAEPEVVHTPLLEFEESDPIADQPQPTPDAADPPLPETHPNHHLGQIAVISEGQVWHQDLATGELRQLTFPPLEDPGPFPGYWKVIFSDSGRYLAYQFESEFSEYAHVGVYDLVSGQESNRLEGMLLIGWRYQEDILLVGENTGFCEPNDPESATPDEEVDFHIKAYNPADQSITPVSTISGGRRLPFSLASQRNLVYLRPAPWCQGIPLVTTIFSDLGESFPVAEGWQFAFSGDGSHYISINYAIHGPDEDALEVIPLGEAAGDQIYFQPGKYISGASWSPDDARILFWQGNVVDIGSYQLIVINTDGSGDLEITPTPSILLGWYDAEHALVVPESKDRIDLVNVVSGVTEVFSPLPEGFDFGTKHQVNRFIWQQLP